jgi:phosphatidylglycerophosphatase A
MNKATSTSVRPGIALTDPGHLLSLGLGAGLMPRAPGTWGALLAVPIYLVLYPHGQAVYITVVAAMFGAGVYLSGRTAKALGVHDHSAIVIDEVVGMLVTWIGAAPGWVVVLVGFVLFRLFDILKPWPIRRVDEGLEGGAGIMLDDLLAGLLAAAVLQLLLYWSPLATAVAGAH